MSVERVLAGGAVSTWLTLSALHREGVATPPCPFKLVFGFDCPGCGATRAGARLLQGDVVGAADHNLLVVAFAALAAVAAVVMVVASTARFTPRFASRRRVIPERVGVHAAAPVSLLAWWSRRRAVVFAVVVATFEVARLVPVAPFSFLASQ